VDSAVENLKYIVIDELHTYRGVFGSHLCNVLRRLRRIAKFYGSEPQFICCSATIANPGELASRLIEDEVEVLSANGAPAGEKTFVFYNPPVVNKALGIRRSYVNETARVAQEFLKHEMQTMVFSNSRLQTEVLLTYLQQANPRPPGKADTIRGIVEDICRTSGARSSAGFAMDGFGEWFRRARWSWD